MDNTTRTRQIFIGIILGLSAGLLLFLMKPPVPPLLPQFGRLVVLVFVGLLLAAAMLSGVQGFTRLMSRWFPISTGEELTYTLADQRMFLRQYRFITLLYLLLTPLIVYLAHLILTGLVGLYYRLIPAVYLLPVSQSYWIIPAIFLGVSLSGIPIWFFNQWRLKERFPRLVAFFNQQYRYDQRKAGLSFTAAGLTICLALVLVGLNLYMRLTPEGVAGNRFFGLIEVTYHYDQITSLEEHVRMSDQDPDRVASRAYLIAFSDGQQWQIGSFASAPVPPSIRQALDYASQRSGQPITILVE